MPSSLHDYARDSSPNEWWQFNFRLPIYPDPPAAADWTATSNQAWVTITGMHTHEPTTNPYGEVHWAIAANGTGLRRTAIIDVVISGQPEKSFHIPILQYGNTIYAFSPNSGTITCASQGVGASLLVDESQSPAVFFLYSPDIWITFTPAGAPVPPNPHFSTRFTFPPYHNRTPFLVGCLVSANTGTTTRTGTFSVYDDTLAQDYFNRPPAPTTPPVATFTVHQLPCGVIPPDDPGGGGTGGPGVFPSAADAPFNLAEPSGYYFRACASVDHNIYVARANNNAPFHGFADGGKATATNQDKRPRLGFQPAHRRVWLVFERFLGGAPGPYYLISEDDGRTWGVPVALDLAGGTHPGPGDPAFSAGYTFKNSAGQPLVAQDDSFHLVMPPNGSALWVLVFKYASDAAPSEWYSADHNAETWTRVA
jgi:hypothetical protein